MTRTAAICRLISLKWQYKTESLIGNPYFVPTSGEMRERTHRRGNIKILERGCAQTRQPRQGKTLRLVFNLAALR